MKLPVEFTEKMRNLLGEEEYETFAGALRQKVITHCLRVNTWKISVEEFLRIFPYPLEPVPWCREAFYLPKGFKASRHPYYHAGLYYLQDPSAALAGTLLSPQPGEKVLDLCAASGGKTTQLGAAVKNKGLLFANDINPRRLQALLKNVENFGLVNTVILNAGPEILAARYPRFFDRVLVDAPCSGEGMFRREPKLTIAWRRNYHPSRCVPVQRRLLEEAAKMVAPGGTLVYSTCTFSPEEDEEQVIKFLAGQPDFYPAVLSPPPGTTSGRGEWAGVAEAPGTVRIWPHRARGEGHFAAVLRREGNGRGNLAGFSYAEPDLKSVAAFTAFCTEVGITPPEGLLNEEDGKLFLLPSGLPKLDNLNIFRAGLFLGEPRPGGFKPAAALALALGRQEVARQLDLPGDSTELTRYLKGETLILDENRAPGKGWILVKTGGFPLGWAKRLGKRVRNEYPPSWRLR